MGRRGVLSMSKLVLPTVSWVAVMRLLKKTPKSLPASRPGMGTEMALKAFMGCGAAPQTDSLRYADDFLAQTNRRRGSGRRPKPAVLLPGCTSRPHTDSFRVHHVVNQEALQLMLSFHDDDEGFDYEESDELCYGIIRDGDRLLHDDIYADDSVCAASTSMGTCSSRLSAATSRSLMTSTAYSGATLSRNSVDSEGVYSTATSASFDNTPSTRELLNIGPHITCNSTPSSSIISSCGASELELIYSDAILDHDLKLEAREEEEVEEEEDEDEAQESKRDQIQPTSSRAEYGLLHAMYSWSAGNELDVDDEGHHENYEGDGDDDIEEEEWEEEEEEEEDEMVAEMRYSENPMEDFAEAISRMVVRQQLNKAAQLQELYCRLLRLNAPSLHHTITLAFLHALQRIASFEPHHLLHTLL